MNGGGGRRSEVVTKRAGVNDSEASPIASGAVEEGSMRFLKQLWIEWGCLKREIVFGKARKGFRAVGCGNT